MIGGNTCRGLCHLHIVHKPIPNGGQGVVAEGHAGTSRRIWKILNFVYIGIRCPVVVSIGVNHHEGGGVCRVGQIAHVKGTTHTIGVRFRTSPEGELQIADGLVKLRQGDDSVEIPLDTQGSCSSGGMVYGIIKMTCYSACQGGPALHGRNGLKIVGVWDGVGAASSGDVDGFGEIAGSGAESLHFELIRCACCQTVNHIGMGGDHRIGIGAFRGFLVVDFPIRITGTGCPVQSDRGVGDVSGS